MSTPTPATQTPCPDESVLRKFLRDELPEEEASRVDRHLGACPACGRLLDRLIGGLPPGLIATAGEPGAAGEDGPPALAGYETLAPVAAGGMGVVWRVRDLQFQRTLAVKVMKARASDNPDAIRRFLAEAQITGQLAHPFIVPIHGMGRLADRRPYYTMKLVEGETLAALLRSRTDPASQRAELLQVFGQICQAMAFAHSRGVIHRDLKPPNVMVGEHGEVQVMDWGLAKVLAGADPPPADAAPAKETPDEVRAMGAGTDPGIALGTWAYMPPEQAGGLLAEVDRRSDVFGLGAVLCEILSGEPPYTGTPEQIKRDAQAGHLAPAHSRLDSCGADPELVRLAKECLQAKAEERPRDAGAVVEAVKAYLARVQERLRQAERAQAQAEVKVQEERKRRRVTVALAAAVVVLLLGGSVVGWWYQQQAAAQERRLHEAQQGIEASLTEVGKLRADGLKKVDTPSACGNTLAAAKTALAHARTLLSQEPDLAETDLAQQAQQAQAELEADAKDQQLLAVYEEVRLEQSQWDGQRRGFKLAESYPRLKKALADYGLAIGGLKVGEAAARLRLRPVAVQKYVQAILDECLAWAPKKEVRQRQWLAAVLAVEADPLLAQLREPKGARAEVKKLAAQVEVARYHPAVLVGLARNLPEEALAGKVLLLRRTQQQYPGDFWVNRELGVALYRGIFPNGVVRRARAEELPVVNEAVAFLRVAVGLRPDNAPAHNNLGAALAQQGDGKGAIACFTKALTLDPKYAMAHLNLGAALYDQKDVKGAIACFTKALALDSKYAPAHLNLGNALYDQKDWKGAIACYTKALALDPEYAPAHTNLGNALSAQKDWKGAIACYHQALALDPKDAKTHNNLGLALAAQGNLDGAITSYHQALALEPKYAQAHNNLGLALSAQKDWKGAIACFTKALTLGPKLARAHYNLGWVLQAQGDMKGAIGCYRKAVELNPNFAEAQCNLGITLREQGHFAKALQALKRGHELGSQRPTWRYPSANWVRQCERLVELDRLLPKVLHGEAEPATAAERLELAPLCQLPCKRLHAAAARLAADAFTADPKLANDQQHRYNAACSAALAAAGQAEDAKLLPDRLVLALRRQALGWLRDDLASYANLLKGDPKVKPIVRGRLAHWLQAADFASVRDKEALARLPEDERAAWHRLWADVEELLCKAQDRGQKVPDAVRGRP
jgi:tetratricopeptide (TPR) repeat protein